jgi:hypothetical protein
VSARNSLKAKAERRRQRQIRHVGGCPICHNPDVAFVAEGRTASQRRRGEVPADPSYPAICDAHLGYALATIFGQAI